VTGYVCDRCPLAFEVGYCCSAQASRHYPMSRQIDLDLSECRAFKNGCVYVTYRVKH
jgi:hypothetical protein